MFIKLKKERIGSMKRQYLPVVLLLCVALAGCGRKKKKEDVKKTKPTQDMFMQVELPTSDTDIQTFVFDDEEDTFVGSNVDAISNISEFTWLEEEDALEDTFKTVYFDFDTAGIRQDQETTIKKNVELAKELLAEEDDITFVIDGHSCSSAGSRAYNLALSEKRAKTLRDRLVAEGIPADKIKIVARGMEAPAMIDGKPVSGDRIAQAPNRRDEVRVLFS